MSGDDSAPPNEAPAPPADGEQPPPEPLRLSPDPAEPPTRAELVAELARLLAERDRLGREGTISAELGERIQTLVRRVTVAEPRALDEGPPPEEPPDEPAAEPSPPRPLPRAGIAAVLGGLLVLLSLGEAWNQRRSAAEERAYSERLGSAVEEVEDALAALQEAQQGLDRLQRRRIAAAEAAAEGDSSSLAQRVAERMDLDRDLAVARSELEQAQQQSSSARAILRETRAERIAKANFAEAKSGLGSEAGGVAEAPSACEEPTSGGPSGRNTTALEDSQSPMVMVGLRQSAFCMGSDPGQGFKDERPRHRVQLSAFSMAQTEVTQAQWRTVIAAAKSRGDSDAAALSEAPSRFAGPRRPAEQLSWCDAVLFANALSRQEGLRPAYSLGEDCESGGDVSWDRAADGFRLPTEAEWEYAARAGSATAYATGDDEHALASAGWYDGNSQGRTHEVCTAAEQPWGLCDLAGNVWEWTWDRYRDHYDGGPLTDPTGPTRGAFRVLRGGSWYSAAVFARAAGRDWSLPSGSWYLTGFRLVLPVPTAPGGVEASP